MKKGCDISDVTVLLQSIKRFGTKEQFETKECVFTCIHDSITFCAIQIAFREGSVGFRQVDILQIVSNKGKKKSLV